jgi:hypothetical protein
MPSKKKKAVRGRPKAASPKKASGGTTAKKKAVKKRTGKASGPAASRATARKATPRVKAAAKKAASGRAAPKKVARKKVTPKKTAAKEVVGKATAKKTTPKAPAKKKVARKSAAKTATKKTAARKTARKAGAKTRTKKTAASKGKRSTLAGAPRRKWTAVPGAPPGAIPGLSEEDQIRSAKYLPRDLPKRLFEEERFLFPESYGVNRVRLLVRDPEWIFAYWDVSPETMKGLARSLGERALALSRLTLRVLDPVSGGMSDILLPPGARWWYIRTDVARRTYRAEIGITLPSGEFRQLAESNAVVTPRVGPSRERARRRLSYRGAGELPPEDAAVAGETEREADLASEPWAAGGDGAAERGGASDAFRPAGGGRADRPGASDAFRPGASDSHRR